MKYSIEISSETETQARNMKEGTTLDQAIARLENLFEYDYLNLSYSLFVNGVLHTTLEY